MGHHWEVFNTKKTRNSGRAVARLRGRIWMAKSWMARSEEVTKSGETFSFFSDDFEHRFCFRRISHSQISSVVFLPQFVFKIITFGISPHKSPFFRPWKFRSLLKENQKLVLMRNLKLENPRAQLFRKCFGFFEFLETRIRRQIYFRCDRILKKNWGLFEVLLVPLPSLCSLESYDFRKKSFFFGRPKKPVFWFFW